MMSKWAWSKKWALSQNEHDLEMSNISKWTWLKMNMILKWALSYNEHGISKMSMISKWADL